MDPRLKAFLLVPTIFCSLVKIAFWNACCIFLLILMGISASYGNEECRKQFYFRWDKYWNK